MVTEPYRYIDTDTNNELGDFARDVARIRERDVDNFNNLTNTFMRGRKVGKIPTGSSDVATTDRVGDFNYDASYLYICVDSGGSAVWRRATLGSW